MKRAWKSRISGSLLFALLVPVAHAAWPTSPEDQVEQLLRAQSQQTSVFRARFGYSSSGSPESQNIVVADLVNGQFDAMRMYPPQVAKKQPYVERWITDGRWNWVGILRYPSKDLVPGGWQMHGYPEGLEPPRRQHLPQDYGIHLLKAALVPYHLLRSDDFRFPEPLPNGMELRIDQWKDEESGLTCRAYRVLQKGVVENQILYRMDLSDGIRIYDTTVSCRFGGNNLKLIHRLELEEFIKVEDRWIPRLIRQTLVDGKLEPYPPSVIRIHEIDVSPDLADGAFQFVGPEESIIQDMSTKEMIYINYPLAQGQ